MSAAAALQLSSLYGVDVAVCVAAMLVTASLVNSLLRKWRESFDERLKQQRLLQDRMAAATSYAEWREFAQQVRGQQACALTWCILHTLYVV